MKSIAKIIHQKKFPLRFLDSNGNKIYSELADGYWEKWKFDDYNNRIYYENWTGHWTKHEFDSTGNQVYCETLNGYLEDNRQ